MAKKNKPKKHVGDVLGISRAQVPAHVPRATKDRGGNPKGIEVAGKRRTVRRSTASLPAISPPAVTGRS